MRRRPKNEKHITKNRLRGGKSCLPKFIFSIVFFSSFNKETFFIFLPTKSALDVPLYACRADIRRFCIRLRRPRSYCRMRRRPKNEKHITKNRLRGGKSCLPKFIFSIVFFSSFNKETFFIFLPTKSALDVPLYACRADIRRFCIRLRRPRSYCRMRRRPISYISNAVQTDSFI